MVMRDTDGNDGEKSSASRKLASAMLRSDKEQYSIHHTPFYSGALSLNGWYIDMCPDLVGGISAHCRGVGQITFEGLFQADTISELRCGVTQTT